MFVGVASQGSGSTAPTTRTVTVPAAAQVGDLAIFVAYAINTGLLPSAPTGGDGGWTETVEPVTAINGTSSIGMWRKTLTSGDLGATLTETLSGGRAQVIACLVYRATWASITALSNDTTAGTTLSVPGVTPADDTVIRISFALAQQSTGNESATRPDITADTLGGNARVEVGTTRTGSLKNGTVYIADIDLTGVDGDPQSAATLTVAQTVQGVMATALVVPIETAEGTATGTVTTSGSAVGQRTPIATSVGTVTTAGAAAGKRSPVAVSTGTTATTGAAVGARTPKASAAGATATSGAAAGYRQPTATATGTTTTTGAAAGKRTPKATTTGTVATTGTATGKRTPTATAAGTTITIGNAVGEAPGVTPATGTATGTTTTTGTAAGKRDPKANGTGTTTVTGTATGYRAPKATAFGTLNTTGTALGKWNPKATATGTILTVGAATGYRMSLGTATGYVSIVGGAIGQDPDEPRNITYTGHLTQRNITGHITQRLTTGRLTT